jgi:hypothetical protein
VIMLCQVKIRGKGGADTASIEAWLPHQRRVAPSIEIARSSFEAGLVSEESSMRRTNNSNCIT